MTRPGLVVFVLMWALMLTTAAVADSAAPRKELLFLGGGGDPPGDSTLFDEPASEAGHAFSGAGWSSTVLFDGGRKKSEAAMEGSFGQRPKPFTEATLNVEIAAVKKELVAGTLKAGDEFLLVIDTHGLEPEKSEKTHTVASSEGPVSLDDLAELRDLLEKAGVRSAIMDLSCYGGATQALATDRTCVVSATSADLVSSEPFQKALFPAVRQGRSLEEAFLDGRARDAGDPSLPGISTPAGRAAGAELHPLSGKLVFYERQLSKTFDSELGGRACLAEESSEINELLANLRNVVTVSNQSQEYPTHITLGAFGGGGSDLAKAMAVYDEDRAKAKEIYREMSALGDREENVEFVGNGRKVAVSFPWMTFLNAKTAAFRAGWELMANDPKLSNEERAVWQLQVQQIGQIDAARARLERNADYRKLKTIEGQYQEALAQLYNDTPAVVAAERRYYNLLYKANAAAPGANPCKDFIL